MKVYRIFLSVLCFLVGFLGVQLYDARQEAQPFDDWCGDAEIRMEGAEVFGFCGNAVEIQTEDGNIWEIENMYLEPNGFYLVWFDTKGTAEIEDDEIVKIWQEVH